MKSDTIRLVYFSPTHASGKIAEAIAQGTAMPHVVTTDLSYPDNQEDPAIDTLTVICVPVYGGRVAETAAERLQSVNANQAPAIIAVTYGNRDYEDALIELRDIAEQRGFRVIAAGAFIGEHSFSRSGRPIAAGRPDADDLQRADRFGQEVIQTIEKFNGDFPPLSVKGNFPYKEKKPSTPETPVTINGLCTQCGYCIDICPTEAIRLNGEIESDASLCIKCCACVKECPNEARKFDTPYTDMLFKHFSTRREPELFYL